jgi:NitT/TauT family transport system permease protein
MLYGALGLGQLLNEGRDLDDINRVVAVMLLIALIGYVVDSILFRRIDATVRQKWGMTVAVST